MRIGTRLAWRDVRVAAVALGLAIVATVHWNSVARRANADVDGLSRVVTGLTHRPIEGRLVGLSYRPFLRQGGAISQTESKRRVLLKTRAAVNGRDRSSAGKHAAALANLLLGNSTAAITALEQSLTQKPADPRLLVDYSAACVEHAAANRSPRHLLLAAEAAEQAWTINHSAEAGWNRALALQQLHLRQDAVAAWNEYLEVEADPAWGNEARVHVAKLAKTDADLWPSLEQRILASASTMDLREAATHFPQSLRLLIEESLLPKWGQLALSGKPEASAALAAARNAAEALAEAGGDSMSRDIVIGVVQYPRVAAAGYVAYGEGIVAYRAHEVDTAIGAFRRAQIAFDTAKLPSSALVAVRSASCAYYKNQYAAVLSDLKDIRRRHAGFFNRYRAWAGQVEWLEGLVSLARGNVDASAACYLRALVHFAASRERGNEAAVHELMAENRTMIGASDEAWEHRLAALDLFQNAERGRRGAAVLMDLAEEATSIGANSVAQRVLGRVIENAARFGDAGMAAHGYLWRATVRARAGALVGARDDLRAAYIERDNMRSADARERFDADVALIEAEIAPSDNVMKRVDTAVRFYSKAQNHLLLAQSLITRASKTNDRTAAIRDYRHALDVKDANAETIADAWQRAIFHESFQAAEERLVDLLLEGGDVVPALEVADLSRSRVLAELASRTDSKPIRLDGRALFAAMPEDIVVVELAVRDRDTIAWVITRAGITVRRLPLPRATLTDLMQRLRTQLMRPAGNWQPASNALYKRMIGPLQGIPERFSRLIIVPDSALENLPFAALYDDVRRQFLIERLEVNVVPAAALLRRSERSRGFRVAVFGDPAFDKAAFPQLARLPGASTEASQVSTLYSGPILRRDGAATRDEFIKALQVMDIVHFGGHAIAAEKPAASRLILASDAASDGALQAAEVVTLAVHARAVTVSACSAGLSAERWSSGASSIAKAFISAGAAAVAAPLWDIEDASSLLLLRAIHRELATGARLGAAARRAQLSILRSHSVPPSTWATFQVIDREME